LVCKLEDTFQRRPAAIKKVTFSKSIEKIPVIETTHKLGGADHLYCILKLISFLKE
jgi:hypothetical protein